MRSTDVFPSSYLKADDLNGRRVTVQIASVKMETLGDGQKPVCYFIGKDKGVVLNRTNWQTIAMIAGTDESDDWHGVAIRLYATPVPFQGKIVNSIRIEAAPQSAPKPATATRKPAAPVVDDFVDTHDVVEDEQIPF